MQHILLKHFDKLQLFVDGSSLHTKFAYRVKISQALVHLCVAEDGVTFTDPPEHTLKRLHLHPLNQSWDKPAAHKHHILIKHRQLCGSKVRCNDLYKIQDIRCESVYYDKWDALCDSPEFGAQSLHTGAACHWFSVQRRELFILRAQGFMLNAYMHIDTFN